MHSEYSMSNKLFYHIFLNIQIFPLNWRRSYMRVWIISPFKIAPFILLIPHQNSHHFYIFYLCLRNTKMFIEKETTFESKKNFCVHIIIYHIHHIIIRKSRRLLKCISWSFNLNFPSFPELNFFFFFSLNIKKFDKYFCWNSINFVFW